MFDALIDKLKHDTYITLETTPGHSAGFDTIIDRIRELGIAEKIDGFTTTDNPLAKLKYNAILAAIRLQNAFNKPVIATMSMRDKNLIALQSDILGANEFNIRAFLMVTGDPAKMSDQPNVKGVFEADSTMLLNIVKYFNAGIDYAGKKIITEPRPIYPFAVANAYSKNFKNIQKKMYKKIENGALGIVTQPVYSMENARILIDLFNEAKSGFSDERKEAQLILGVFPITRLKTAQFLASHVPGIHVPGEWVDKLFEANKLSEEEEQKVGFGLSHALFKDIMQVHPKVHIMTANRFDIARELLES
jgi:5,10-methylenetetrahydrofolate reductase